MALATAAEAPRQELFRRLNMVGGGAAALVKLRGRLLGLLPARPHLRPVDADLRHLLSASFNGGFLQLEQISWETPAATLERLIAYEAVHEIHGWDDLRLRLAADRRCFAFFHPLLPGEPLIFVEIALTRDLPDRDRTTARRQSDHRRRSRSPYGGLLLDQRLPTRVAGHLVRQLSHQAGGEQALGRAPGAADLRNPVAPTQAGEGGGGSTTPRPSRSSGCVR